MDQNDWLILPSFACRTCAVTLDVHGTVKRPVSEFYVFHPPGPCPLSGDGVIVDAEGNLLKKVWEKGEIFREAV